MGFIDSFFMASNIILLLLELMLASSTNSEYNPGGKNYFLFLLRNVVCVATSVELLFRLSLHHLHYSHEYACEDVKSDMPYVLLFACILYALFLRHNISALPLTNSVWKHRLRIELLKSHGQRCKGVWSSNMVKSVQMLLFTLLLSRFPQALRKLQSENIPIRLTNACLLANDCLLASDCFVIDSPTCGIQRIEDTTLAATLFLFLLVFVALRRPSLHRMTRLTSAVYYYCIFCLFLCLCTFFLMGVTTTFIPSNDSTNQPCNTSTNVISCLCWALRRPSFHRMTRPTSLLTPLPMLYRSIAAFCWTYVLDLLLVFL
ncbi:hypothetical protein Bhyg_08131 [Pseudolycoriella hygida]|uniref:Gustatory receptor n=1 Tax=Pseudolycoriella hygida TaxID=35572 RepID=A0A9Q0N446_9DIPT|nr:hypothetical protein Bhyg_08131 [Pseudolycoriella hygida]